MRRFALLVLLIHSLVSSSLWASDLTDQLQVIVMDGNNQPVKDVVVIVPDQIHEQLPRMQEGKMAVMDQKDKAFVPHVLVVDQHTYVSFPNSDNIRHHVYSFSDAKRFEIKLYADTPESPVLLDKPGPVVLGCNIHDAMVGHIFVSRWRHYGQTNESGKAVIAYSKSEPNELLLWHPRLKDPSKPIRVGNLDWNGRTAELGIVELLPKPIKKKSRFR